MIISIAREKDHLEVKGIKFYGENFQKLISCPDRKTFKNGRFIFLNSHSNIDHIINSFENISWDQDALEFKNNLFNFKEKENNQLVEKNQDFLIKDYPDIFKTKPFDHQLKAFEISKDLNFYGLFFEQGCGKTKVVIDNATYLFKLNKVNSLIIIAPNGVHKNWITDELPTHCKQEYDAFCWEGNLNKNNLKRLNEVQLSNNLKIFSFNVESFVSVRQQEMLQEIIKSNKCLLVIDESQTIKNPTAKRTKFLVDKISKMVDYKRIMSGTPVTKGIQDLYTQFKFLSPEIIGISSYFAFKNKYCLLGGFQMKQIIGYKGVEELQRKVDVHTMRVLKKDCLDLPEKLYQKAPFVLTEEQIRIYNEIKDEGITFINRLKEDGQPITLDNVLTRMKKLQQIANGYLLNVEDKEIIEIIPPEKNPRLLKLKEILENIEGKVIIWTIYTQDIKYISNMLGSKAVRYDGRISSEEKEINKESFKKNPAIKYLIANTQAMARGHTLTEAETSIYYSNSFDLELRLQSEDRNHRTGTKNNVLYIDLQAEKTLDRKIIRALRSKKKIADMVLQDPDNLFMEN